MTAPLDGIRVLDLTQVMAGPFCTMLLGDLGADVIKIEPPTGDLSRGMGGARLRGPSGESAPFLALNRNKRSVVLDLKRDDHRAAFHALARTADVVVENFRPGVVQRLGVDYDSLAPGNPRIVYASISGFGHTGAWADRPGFDLVAQAMSGIMSVTGEPDGAPVKAGVPIADLSAGLFAANGIMAALVARDRTGKGQLVETSLFESALALAVWESAEYWATGEAPRALGSAHRLSAPYQVFRTRDGHIALAALTSPQWTRLCAALDRPTLAEDPRFATNDARMMHRAALTAEIEAALQACSTDEWVERLLAAGVPAGPMLDFAQVFEAPHTADRAMIQDVAHPTAGTVRTLGSPVKMSEHAPHVRRPPPLLGQHTEEVLGELRMRVTSSTSRNARRGGDAANGDAR